jgi:hypothetical protein
MSSTQGSENREAIERAIQVSRSRYHRNRKQKPDDDSSTDNDTGLAAPPNIRSTRPDGGQNATTSRNRAADSPNRLNRILLAPGEGPMDGRPTLWLTPPSPPLDPAAGNRNEANLFYLNSPQDPTRLRVNYRPRRRRLPHANQVVSTNLDELRAYVQFLDDRLEEEGPTSSPSEMMLLEEYEMASDILDLLESSLSSNRSQFGQSFDNLKEKIRSLKKKVAESLKKIVQSHKRAEK